MSNDPKKDHNPNLFPAFEAGLRAWEQEINMKMGQILRNLEIFEDENCIYVFYENNKVGEISCTWRKFETREDYIESEETEKAAADPFKKFFYDVFYSNRNSNTWQANGKWEKGVARATVEGLNFVHPKRFFNKVFGDQDNLKTWLLQNFCNFCFLGLSNAYEKELIFEISQEKSKPITKSIMVNSDVWNLILLGQPQTYLYKDGTELYVAGDDYYSSVGDEAIKYYELSICRFNQNENYDVSLYVFKSGMLGNLDNVGKNLLYQNNLYNVGKFYNPGIRVK